MRGDGDVTTIISQACLRPKQHNSEVINSLHLCPLSLSFAGVCHLVTQATPSAKGVACVTICCCRQRDSHVCILLYIVYLGIIS